MKYDKLRIAWSVAWGVVCLLLVALWVRSFYWHDFIQSATPVAHVRVTAGGGKVVLKWSPLDPGSAYDADPWHGTQKQNAPKDFYLTSFPSQFGHNRIVDSIGVYHSYWLPIWFLILVAATMATVPWLPLRFSLRTLLVVTTLLAVGLGSLVYALR